ncbi:WD40-repeat-containing domain protein [Lanmaoa asiatica]|nr:WD40-repeat-containing domain protein [Lanmaoa asiatica]
MVRVWDAHTHEQVLDIKDHTNSVFSVDVSPDSTRFATGSAEKLAFVWSMTTGEKLVGPLQHDGWVVAVRFSPNGDRIATAAAENPDAKAIRIYNSKNGQRLLDIPFPFKASISSHLTWSGDGHRLFAGSFSRVRCFDTSLGSLLGEWSAPGGGWCVNLVLSHNQKFLVVAAYLSLSFWDASTHEQIGTVLNHPTKVWSIALSPNDDCIAIGEASGKITLRNLCDILPASYLTSIEVQRSVIGHIASAMAHVGDGEYESAMRAFDLVFTEGFPTENKFFLLIRAIILFECGKHDDAISRVDDLIDIVDDQSIYLTVQAQMFLPTWGYVV